MTAEKLTGTLGELREAVEGTMRRAARDPAGKLVWGLMSDPKYMAIWNKEYYQYVEAAVQSFGIPENQAAVKRMILSVAWWGFCDGVELMAKKVLEHLNEDLP